MRNTRFTRRDALKASLGLGAIGAAGVSAGAAGCGTLPDRCAGRPPATGAPSAAGDLLASVDTVVVVMMENRSFDHMLGGLRTDRAYPGAARVDGLTGGEGCPDPDGQMVMVSGLPGPSTLDPRHDWASSRLAFNDGRNDGFVRVNAGPNQGEAMAFRDRAQLPLLYALADDNVVCDRWFSSVMGPTWPNRFYLHAATSQGRRKNQPMGLAAPPTVWEQMAARCLTAKNYYASAIPWYSAAFPAKSFSGQDAMTPEPIDRFFADAARGELPNFAVVDPDFQTNDGHPPHDLALSEAFLGSIHRAMAAGPQWSRSLLVITFDEHGGFYDHVPPPQASDPDPDFRQLGFRVPAIVVGPSVRRGAVVSTPFDHVSVLSTLRARFGIASLGARMDAAADLSACLDPERAAAARAGVTTAAAALGAPRLPPTITVTGAHARAAAALRTTSQPEVERLAAAGRVPRAHIDPRTPQERLRAWLRHAQELEAVRVIG